MLKYKTIANDGLNFNPTLNAPTSEIRLFDVTGNYNFYNTEGWGAPNTAKTDVFLSHLYVYDANNGQYFYPYPGQNYLDLSASPSFLPFNLTNYDLTLAEITGNKQTGNYEQGIYVINNYIEANFAPPYFQDASISMAIVSDVICRKLQVLSDDILYQRACKGKCKQYDDLSRVWNLCYQQFMRTQIDYLSYELSSYGNVVADMNEAMITNPELRKCVLLFNEALSIALQEVDCNGCK